MTPNVRQWLALFTAASFAASGIGAYVHLALQPHHYCPEHGRFEADPVAHDRHHAGPVHEASETTHATPGHPEPLPVDYHHTCPAMAFATTPVEMGLGPAPMPAPTQVEATAPPAEASALPVPVAAIRLAPKASPPA